MRPHFSCLAEALKGEFNSIGVFNEKIVSCGRFVQFTDKQGLGCLLHKLYFKERKLNEKQIP
ncbi:hypothetical protein FIM42_06895 [Helicobacter pylori]|nr:hypothetical protein FIM42_06895 [Helicobacter pylori]TPI02596.1 hypothetical protein FIM41_06700 [Helicobacter pylori]